MTTRHDLVDLILMALDDPRAPSIARTSATAVVELPEPEWDDDGQAWLDDIRVDLTGSKIHHRAYVGKAHTPSTAAAMRNDASRLLAAAKLLEESQAQK